MFSPLSALSAFAGGIPQGLKQAREDDLQRYDLMGMEALGRAFQQPQMPPTIAPVPGIGQPGPTPPMPGQPSVPAQPSGPQVPPGPQVAAGGGLSGGPPMAPPAGLAGPAGGAPMPPRMPQAAPGMPPGGPQAGPGGPGGGAPMAGQFDLMTLASRIQRANPNLPPQAMYSALARAAPLLNAQGRQELQLLRQQLAQQGLELRSERLDLDRQRLDEQRRQQRPDDEGRIGGYTPQALEQAAEHFINTGQYPPGLRDRAGGNALRAAIANRAAEIVDERHITAKDVDKRRQEFKAEQLAINRFMSGPQGNTIRSLGVVVDHLTTMRELAVALQNQDVQAFNRIANAWGQQFGLTAPTNAQTAAQIVGAEVIKALGVAGAGTKEERQEAGNAFGTARTEGQLIEAIDKVVKPLMLGQLKGLRRQFKVSTGLPEDKFDALLGDEAQDFFRSGGQHDGASQPPAAPRATFDERFGGARPAVQMGPGWTVQVGQ
jgi:hypothetical protein